jgi:UDP-N-acetylmuramate dehydrogenase
LSRHTTIGIGGPAAFFTEVSSPAEIIDAVNWADRQMLPIFVLGGGSNVLVADEGFDGLVIRIGCKGLTFKENGSDKATAEVAAGEIWDDFVKASVRQGLWGVECLSGIPGTAGGAPIQNIGAYGQDVSQTIISVRQTLRSESLQTENAGSNTGRASSILIRKGDSLCFRPRSA